MDLFDLSGKLAIVTGSTTGIGRAIARRMAERGARVVISSRTKADCDQVAAEIVADFGEGRAISIPADVARLDTLEALVEQAVEKLGGLDILVCNGRVPCPGVLEEWEPEAFNGALEANITNMAMMLKRAAPHMASRGGGSIVLISSTAGVIPMADRLVYGITKIAARHLAATLAVHLGRQNIRVNAIAPGGIRTEGNRHILEKPGFEKKLTAGLPLLRIGEPDEIAATAVYLCSPGGAYVTGQTIVVDGGQVLTGVWPGD